MSYRYGSSSSDDWSWVVQLIAILLVLILGGCFASAECSGKFRGSGYETRWGPVSMCQVQLEDGRWIPADSFYYRED